MDRERIGSFEQMKVWQESHALVLKVFEATSNFGGDGGPASAETVAEMIEKAAIDVPKNIAEGFRRRGTRNKAHYYNVAQSALEGLRYYFILARDLKFPIDYEDLSYRGDQIARMLDGLVRSMRRTEDRRGGRGGRGGGGRGGSRGRGGPGSASEGGGEGSSDDDDFDRPAPSTDDDEDYLVDD